MEIASDVISPSYRFIFITLCQSPLSLPLFQPHAFTVALTPSGFLLFIFCFSFFFTSSLPLSGVLLPSPPKRRKIDGTTNWFCQSCRGDSHVDGLCRLKRKGAAQQRWKNVETTKHGPRRPERFVTGIQRSGRATFITVACFFLVGSFVRFPFFFPFSSAFFPSFYHRFFCPFQ